MEPTMTEVQFTSARATAKKRVAAYARVSGGRDAMLHSLAAQVDHYGAYIRNQPEWEFAGIYADEALTGTKDSRAEFKKLLAACRAGQVDMIVTKSISRFARNTVLLLKTVRELRQLGVDVYFEEQNLHTISGDGEFLLTILAAFAQAESLSCSDNCKWRIRNNFKAGIAIPPRLYGYDHADKQLTVNPAEAAVVREIYADYLSGMGKNAIMRKLNARGVPTKNGGLWHDNGIDSILRNEKYTGNMLLQKTYVADHLTKATKRNTGELPMYFIRGSHEAIISESLFKEVQAELARRRDKRTPASRPPDSSAFSGKLRCGLCGANFKRKTTAYNVIWRCATFDTRGKACCPARQIPEGILKEMAAEVLGLAVYDAEVFKAQIREIRVPESGVLVFIRQNGEEVRRTWKNPSRSESWTPEMREQARRKALGKEQAEA